jgi:choline dehydrogenase-like flavoprotein
MIRDLSTCVDDQTVDADVCVVGGGIAGLIVAHRIRRYGRSVLVLESGGRADPGGIDPLNNVLLEAQPYRGATHGRARGLGGTSTRWGGALIPFLREDLAARFFLGLEAWPFDFDDVAPFFSEAEHFFGLDDTSYEEAVLDIWRSPGAFPRADQDMLLRFAKWPHFKKRNVATLLRPRLDEDTGMVIWLNATVTSFKTDESAGRLAGIGAVARSGRKLAARAKEYVICAGALETTRLLLLLQRQSAGRVFSRCEALGRGLHDHVLLTAAVIETTQPTEINRLAGFRFHGATMRSARFELAPRVQQEERVSSSFGQITFETPNPTGYDALRETLQTVQSTGHLDVRKTLGVARDLPYLLRAAWWRSVRHQLLWPKPARYRLHIVAEQLPKPHNRVRLTDEPDDLGVPRASLAWQVDADEFRAASAFARRFDAYWQRHRLTRLGKLVWDCGLLRGEKVSPDNIGDAYHPGGTTRMGRDGQTAVVNRDLTTFAVPNLSVASTSAFPSGASANPTLMLIAFALRLADHLGTAW